MKIQTLLKAYVEILNYIDNAKLPWLSISEKAIFRIIKIPYSRRMLKYLMIWHIDRTIERIRKLYVSEIYISDQASYEDELKRVDGFQKYLSKIPYKSILFIYLFTIFIIAQFFFVDSNDVQFIKNILSGLFTLNARDVINTLTGLTDKSILWRSIGFLVIIWGYIGFPLYTAFAAKRILFNVYPNIVLFMRSNMTEYSRESKGFIASKMIFAIS